ncbi:hypothetical protein MTO96_020348 [Rhipicephalus appendiculatus]
MKMNESSGRLPSRHQSQKPTRGRGGRGCGGRVAWYQRGVYMCGSWPDAGRDDKRRRRHHHRSARSLTAPCQRSRESGCSSRRSETTLSTAKGTRAPFAGLLARLRGKPSSSRTRPFVRALGKPPRGITLSVRRGK